MEAFVYCWTDHTTGKLYIGCHKGSFNDGYICSSKKVKEQYNQRPNDFSRTIIAVGVYADMLKLETAILTSVGARKNVAFYNMHNGDGKFYNKGFTEETKKKQRASRLRALANGAKMPPPKLKLSEAHKEAVRQGCLRGGKMARYKKK